MQFFIRVPTQPLAFSVLAKNSPIPLYSLLEEVDLGNITFTLSKYCLLQRWIDTDESVGYTFYQFDLVSPMIVRQNKSETHIFITLQ